MNAEQLITRTLAMPHTHEVVTRYANGQEHSFTTRSLGTAKSFADRERRKIGRDLIEQGTGRTVRVVEVEVRAIVAD